MNEKQLLFLPMQRKKQTAEVLLSGEDATLPLLGC